MLDAFDRLSTKNAMKITLFNILFLSLTLVSCDKTTATEKEPNKNKYVPVSIPTFTISDSLLFFDKSTSHWYLNDTLFSGYAVSYHKDTILKDKVGFVKGRKQNQASQWYIDGHLKEVSHYQEGKLDGLKKRWSADSSHILIAHLNYKNGRAHGEQKLWYPTGELFKKLNLNMGQEEGLQQAYRKNGVVYANYEAKEGRIFGLKKAALCFGLEEEKVRYE